jgi:hypothetical protein
MLAERPEWSPPALAWMLKEAGADVISEPLAALVASVSASRSRHFARLVRMLEMAHARDATPVVQQIIPRTQDQEVLVACLRVIRGPSEMGLVRGLLHHEAWQVRMLAAIALGKYGGSGDETSMLRAMSDREWWVRHHAAASLLKLPSSTPPRIQQILSNEEYNPFARDALRQVLAEDNGAV